MIGRACSCWGPKSGGEFAQSQGVFPALYYFGLLPMRGHHEADYRGSRPLLSDGIFQLKTLGRVVHDGWLDIFSCPLGWPISAF